jgi:hypothetical protein
MIIHKVKVCEKIPKMFVGNETQVTMQWQEHDEGRRMKDESGQGGDEESGNTGLRRTPGVKLAGKITR